jgi:hypothetical protein
MECDKCFEVGLFLDEFCFVLVVKLNSKAIWKDKLSFIILYT